MARGIDTLRAKRGDEQATFDDVADHLVDFAERHPDQVEVVRVCPVLQHSVMA